jgi:hypothetical protein
VQPRGEIGNKGCFFGFAPCRRPGADGGACGARLMVPEPEHNRRLADASAPALVKRGKGAVTASVGACQSLARPVIAQPHDSAASEQDAAQMARALGVSGCLRFARLQDPGPTAQSSKDGCRQLKRVRRATNDGT